jgi:hypothetical protein
MVTDSLPLSVAIITKNEEERLADCLASVELFKYLKLWELQQQGSLPGDRPGQGGV